MQLHDSDIYTYTGDAAADAATRLRVPCPLRHGPPGRYVHVCVYVYTHTNKDSESRVPYVTDHDDVF